MRDTIIRFVLLICLITFTVSISTSALAQDNEPQKRRLTLEAAFGKPYIDGQTPALLRISPDDKWIACAWADDARGYTELWLFSTDGSRKKRLTDTKQLRHKELTEENNKVENVDDRKTEDEMVEALEHEFNFTALAWDKSSESLWFIYRGDLCTLNPFDESEQITDFARILKLDGSVSDLEFCKNGTFLALSIGGEIWIRRQSDGALWKLTASIQGGKAAYGLEWSSSGRYLGFYEYDYNGLRTSWMADYMSFDVTPIPLTRPRPGDSIGRTKFGIIDILAENEPELTEISLDGVDEIYGEQIRWAPDCDRLLVSKISKDTETLSVWEVIDLETGKSVKTFEYTDEAWFNDAYYCIYWGPERDSFICLLEKTGWSQVYQVDFGEILTFEKEKYEKEKKEAETEKTKLTDTQATIDDTAQTASPAEDETITEGSETQDTQEIQNIDTDTGELQLPEETAPETQPSTQAEPQSPPNPEPQQITFGEFEVTWLQVMNDRRTAYIITTEDGPAYRTIQKLDIPTRGKKRLTPRTGMYSFSAAWGEGMRTGDSEKMAVVYGSDFGIPAQLNTLDLDSVGTRLILDSRPPEWNTWRWVIPENISYMNTEYPGRVHALLYLPPYHKEGDKRPVIVHIHGGGYWQDVIARHSWFDGLHTYMADTLGYAVLDVDYRGSSGYGRNWRTEVVNRLGKIEDSDARAGVEYLKRSGIVDPELVGIWGWSYGGFQTNMSMFISPDYWKTGVAMAAVNDWHNYNHWYVTQRLDDPKDNEEAYKLSSPITHCTGLKGNLLMVHGILDDNVMAQDFMQLTAKLINENRKFDVFMFPEDSHGINSTDRMIYFSHLVCDYFENHFGRGVGAPEADQEVPASTN